MTNVERLRELVGWYEEGGCSGVRQVIISGEDARSLLADLEQAQRLREACKRLVGHWRSYATTEAQPAMYRWFANQLDAALRPVAPACDQGEPPSALSAMRSVMDPVTEFDAQEFAALQALVKLPKKPIEGFPVRRAAPAVQGEPPTEQERTK